MDWNWIFITNYKQKRVENNKYELKLKNLTIKHALQKQTKRKTSKTRLKKMEKDDEKKKEKKFVYGKEQKKKKLQKLA